MRVALSGPVVLSGPVRVLALDAAGAGCFVALVVDGKMRAERRAPGGRGQAALLPTMARDVLAEAGAFDLVAVTVGPGSFTGLRGAIALAHGLALGAGCPVVGVTVAEALAEALPKLPGREIWVALDNHRGRVFLDVAGVLAAWPLDGLPRPDGPVALAGDQASEVATRLAAQGHDVTLTDSRHPRASHVAAVGLRRASGGLPALAAQPLYVEPPEARLPAGGLRPVPAG